MMKKEQIFAPYSNLDQLKSKKSRTVYANRGSIQHGGSSNLIDSLKLSSEDPSERVIKQSRNLNSL